MTRNLISGYRNYDCELFIAAPGNLAGGAIAECLTAGIFFSPIQGKTQAFGANKHLRVANKRIRFLFQTIGYFYDAVCMDKTRYWCKMIFWAKSIAGLLLI